jgi:hypothetical protein
MQYAPQPPAHRALVRLPPQRWSCQGQSGFRFPRLCRYAYDLSGSSSFGPVRAEAAFTAEVLGPSAQRWMMDARDQQVHGSMETLGLEEAGDNIQLNA